MSREWLKKDHFEGFHFFCENVCGSVKKATPHFSCTAAFGIDLVGQRIIFGDWAFFELLFESFVPEQLSHGEAVSIAADGLVG